MINRPRGVASPIPDRRCVRLLHYSPLPSHPPHNTDQATGSDLGWWLREDGTVYEKRLQMRLPGRVCKGTHFFKGGRIWAEAGGSGTPSAGKRRELWEAVGAMGKEVEARLKRLRREEERKVWEKLERYPSGTSGSGSGSGKVGERDAIVFGALHRGVNAAAIAVRLFFGLCLLALRGIALTIRVFFQTICRLSARVDNPCFLSNDFTFVCSL